MPELLFRTEDIRPDEILDILVETRADRETIDQLKGRAPVVLRGSRGVGKSFLLRAAEAELSNQFAADRVLPVYVTFARASLIADPTPSRFLSWMMAKLCNRLSRALRTHGCDLGASSALRTLRGDGNSEGRSALESLEARLEDSWQGEAVEESSLSQPVPGPEDLMDAIEDICREMRLRRIVLFIDEAAHVFIPEQQRQFFTLMRDIRSPYLAVKAAVYPGATSYGTSFQMSHDATLISVDRSVTDDGYASSMREMVYKQDASLRQSIETQGDVFDTLAFAATGNPRILLKTLARSTPLNRRNAQESVRGYYREDIWTEHSGLSERYPGHEALIDWGRQFIENEVLPALHRRNSSDPNDTSSFIWVHKDAPQTVKEALRLLCYSGVLQEGISGIRATRSEIGTRYMVNLGCQFALDGEPISFGANVRRNLSVKRMIEFGANHALFRDIARFDLDAINDAGNQALAHQLARSTDVLDITPFQREKLDELGLATVGAVLAASEKDFQKAWYVGETRARQIRNAAIAAVYEYLSG